MYLHWPECGKCKMQEGDKAEVPEAKAKQATKKGMPSLAELEATILSLVHDLIGPDVTPDAPLSSQGLDSLAAMELRQKLQVRLDNLTPC